MSGLPYRGHSPSSWFDEAFGERESREWRDVLQQFNCAPINTPSTAAAAAAAAAKPQTAAEAAAAAGAPAATAAAAAGVPVVAAAAAAAGAAGAAAAVPSQKGTPRRPLSETPQRDALLARIGGDARLDRAYGCIFGAFLGDAGGAPLEFAGKPEELQVQQALRWATGKGAHNVAPGQITDDGELSVSSARGLCKGLAACGPGATFSEEVMDSLLGESVLRYADWLDSYPFDVGNTTRQALSPASHAAEGAAAAVRALGAAREAAARVSGGNQANGSLMRATPLAVVGSVLSAADAHMLGRADSALTHANDSVREAVGAYVAAASALVRGEPVTAAVAAAEGTVPLGEEVQRWLAAAERGEPLPIYVPGKAGWCAIALSHAFHHLRAGTEFKRALAEVLIGGGDTDTNACIVGGLLGARVGLRALPADGVEAVLTCDTSLGQPRPRWLHPAELARERVIDDLLAHADRVFGGGGGGDTSGATTATAATAAASDDAAAADATAAAAADSSTAAASSSAAAAAASAGASGASAGASGADSSAPPPPPPWGSLPEWRLTVARGPAAGRAFHVGAFETPSVEDLRQRLAQRLGAASWADVGLKGAAAAAAGPRGVTYRNVVGDVRELLADRARGEGAVFQVASQVNCLEMVSPGMRPDDGVTRYEGDPTQGPACAISCPAATVFRNYFVPRETAAADGDDDEDGGVGGQCGGDGVNTRQLDTCAAVGARVGNGSTPGRVYWRVKNGYVLPVEKDSLQLLNARLDEQGPAGEPGLGDELRGLVGAGIHWSTDVGPHGGDTAHRVCQVFSSAMPVSYSYTRPRDWAPLARIVLDGAYEIALLTAALLAHHRGRRVTLYLTSLGGGAFGNPTQWITDAVERAVTRHIHLPVDIVQVHYRVIEGQTWQLLEQRLQQAAAAQQQ